MNFFRIAFSLMFMLFPSISYSAEDYKVEIKEFFDLYEEGRFDEAIDRIYQSNKYRDKIQDQLINLKTNLRGLSDLVGEYKYKAHIEDIVVADQFVQSTYLLIFDRQPVRFEFQFFGKKGDWTIYLIQYDDGLPAEVLNSARQSVLDNAKTVQP